MTIIDTTTVSVLFALIAVALFIAFVATGIALAKVYAARRPAPAVVVSAPGYVHGRLAH